VEELRGSDGVAIQPAAPEEPPALREVVQRITVRSQAKAGISGDWNGCAGIRVESEGQSED